MLNNINSPSEKLVCSEEYSRLYYCGYKGLEATEACNRPIIYASLDVAGQ